MFKSVLMLLTAMVAGWMVVGSTTGASARYRASAYHASSCCGGPIAPTYLYRTTHRVAHVTRYRDVSRTRYVQRIHPIVHITRVQPILYVHTITRVHHHTVGVIHDIYRQSVRYLPTYRVYSQSVVNTYSCGCR